MKACGRLRVVIAGDFPEHPPDVVGGIQAVIYSTLEPLSAYGDLDLHVVSCEKRAVRRTSREPAEDGGRWRVHNLPSPPRLPHTATMLTVDRWRLAGAIRALAPDVVHAHGQAAAYPWAAFDAGAPAVVTVHGINALEARLDPRGGMLRARLRAWMWTQVERACLHRARDIVVISPFVAQTITPHTHARLHAIENPVRPGFFDIARDAVVAGRVLYVGSIQRRKGLADLVRAAAALRELEPPVHVRVAGACPPPYAGYGAEVRALASELGVADRVTFLGNLGPAALLAEYAHCAVFCLPSYLEASPVVVAEAMAAGCPVVTTTIASTAHLIEDGVTGYRVAPGAPGALAERLRAVLAEAAQARALGAAARAAAQERFRPERAAAALHRLYGELAEAAGQVRP